MPGSVVGGDGLHGPKPSLGVDSPNGNTIEGEWEPCVQGDRGLPPVARSCRVRVPAAGDRACPGRHGVDRRPSGADLGVLPRALRDRSAAAIRSFEETFEPLGLTALAIQVVKGVWMGWIVLPGFRGLLNPGNPIGMLVGVKLLLLAATAAPAIHARLRLLPNLTDDNLSALAWHIRSITALAIAFVVVGALIRLGGLG